MYQPKHTRKIKVEDDKKIPWYKTSWKVIVFISTVFIAIISQSPMLLQNVRNLPEEIDTTWEAFLSWLKEDEEWNGYYSSFPEGIINIEDMKLSDVDMKIIINASRGEIGGSIYTKEICSSFPSLGFLQLSGIVTITGNSINDVVVWDVVDGKVREFAKINIVKDKDIITIKPTSGNVGLFPKNARLGKHPNAEETEKSDEFRFSKQCTEQLKTGSRKLNEARLKK